MIKLDDILFKHLILFDYDTSESVCVLQPHHVFKIEDSIHYKCIMRSDFIDYSKLITTTIQPEHSIEKFSELIKKFDINRLKTEKIRLEWEGKLNKYITLDGCHRLSIIKYNKLDNDGYLPDEYFDIKKD